MPLTADVIGSHPRLLDALKQQSAALLDAYRVNPRVSSTFATQQRWLLAHIGLALHFEREGDHPGITSGRFLERVLEHAVSSRNTADAFLKEMLRYDVIRFVPVEGDRRIRPMEPSEAATGAIYFWILAHLRTLDSLEGEQRIERFLGDPDATRKIQPRIADGLLRSSAIREPIRTFSLFTWLNNGGIIMDWLIAGLGDEDPAAGQYATPVMSIADLASWLRLSRSHLTRKLREAEAMGSIGWHGVRGKSAMWVSTGFVREMVDAQSAKLAIIDHALEDVLPR